MRKYGDDMLHNIVRQHVIAAIRCSGNTCAAQQRQRAAHGRAGRHLTITTRLFNQSDDVLANGIIHVYALGNAAHGKHP